MKSGLTLCVALVVALVAAPAFAGDGNVSTSTLKSLGLGGMTVVSDAHGMQVRGMASIAISQGTSNGAFFLFDPQTGGFIVGAAANGAGGFGANPTGISNAAHAQATGGSGGLAIFTPNTAYVAGFSVSFGGFGAASAN